jgi:hypothetical protein
MQADSSSIELCGAAAVAEMMACSCVLCLRIKVAFGSATAFEQHAALHVLMYSCYVCGCLQHLDLLLSLPACCTIPACIAVAAAAA